MTARRFLEKHGLLDARDYQRRLVEQGAPEAVSVQYPLSNLRYRDLGAGYNVLLITVDNLNYSRFERRPCRRWRHLPKKTLTLPSI
ncbi:DUF3413 domain-containing protein [Klebsiella pneumoniae subsp. pneumoniae]|nr:DUF3413 domain-containing protein [Klebsiella pneumoniae subsp. pneumoniae]